MARGGDQVAGHFIDHLRGATAASMQARPRKFLLIGFASSHLHFDL
jgi:hypothetical protein